MQFIDDGGVDRIVDEDANAVKAVGKTGGILIELCLKKFELNAMLFSVFFKGGTVIGLGVEKCDFHICLRAYGIWY